MPSAPVPNTKAKQPQFTKYISPLPLSPGRWADVPGDLGLADGLGGWLGWRLLLRGRAGGRCQGVQMCLLLGLKLL